MLSSATRTISLLRFYPFNPTYFTIILQNISFSHPLIYIERSSPLDILLKINNDNIVRNASKEDKAAAIP